MTLAVTLPPLPALVDGTVHHARRTPVHHAFTHGAYQWLVDVDDLPRPHRPVRWLAGFRAEDHLDRGRLGGGIRGDVERFLEHRGVHLDPTDRVVMLANARVLGHVFDPLSVHWCLRADGVVRAVLLEVHNTYGERHVYLLHPADDGSAEVAKDFYVSPFNDVDGHYAVRLRLEPGRVAVSVRLERDGRTVLTAVTSGTPEPATTRALLRLVRRHGPMTQRVTALIRLHGVRLWSRRLPVRPRPHHPEEAVR